MYCSAPSILIPTVVAGKKPVLIHESPCSVVLVPSLDDCFPFGTIYIVRTTTYKNYTLTRMDICSILIVVTPTYPLFLNSKKLLTSSTHITWKMLSRCLTTSRDVTTPTSTKHAIVISTLPGTRHFFL
jgi:hypothetical protein